MRATEFSLLVSLTSLLRNSALLNGKGWTDVMRGSVSFLVLPPSMVMM